MEWNKTSHIARMQPHANKLVTHLQKQGIIFSPTDEHLENIVFTSDKKIMKMSHHSFYRYSGIAVFCRDKGENFSETVEVTDEMYINIIIKPIVENFFK